MSTLTTPQYTVLAPGDGLRVASGPGRDLIFKVTGEETGRTLALFRCTQLLLSS